MKLLNLTSLVIIFSIAFLSCQKEGSESRDQVQDEAVANDEELVTFDAESIVNRTTSEWGRVTALDETSDALAAAYFTRLKDAADDPETPFHTKIFNLAVLYHYSSTHINYAKTQLKSLLPYGATPEKRLFELFLSDQSKSEKLPTISTILRGGASKPTAQLHFQSKFGMVYNVAYNSTEYEEKMNANPVVFLSGKTYVPMFISHDLTSHAGQHSIPYEKHEYTYLASALLIDETSAVFKGLESLINDFAAAFVEGDDVNGSQHLSTSTHCHEPLNGRVIDDCDENTFRNENGTPYIYRQPEIGVTKSDKFPFSDAIPLTLPPRLAPASSDDDAIRITEARIMGVTVMEKITLDGEVDRPWPVAPKFFAFDPKVTRP